jgi:AcrR family transcriptional regulator
VPAEGSGTRRHILEATEKLLSTRSSVELRIAEVAHDSDVAVQTIYYHFGSFGRLIAEAQMSAYLHMAEPSRRFLNVAEVAATEGDEDAYRMALGDNIEHLWSFMNGGDEWRISKLLIDVWSDQHVRLRFCELLDVQFERWIAVIEAGKRRGWFNPELDAPALIASCWAATNGQAILSNMSRVRFTPGDIRNLWAQIGKIAS